MFLKTVESPSYRSSVASELMCSDESLFTKNYFLALDIKKWRIAPTIAAYKSDDL